MLILDRDGTRLWNRWGGRTDAHDNRLIDRLIGAVFAHLRCGVVELRLRPVLLITVRPERADAAHAGRAAVA
jgi:hypothetical protein